MHFRALVRRAPPRRAGTMVMAAPVIMQPEFQQSVLFFPEGALDSVYDQSAGHFSCMCTGTHSAKLCRKWPRSSTTLAMVSTWLFLLVRISRCVRFFCWQGRDARHHGWYGLRQCRNLWKFHSCSSRTMWLTFLSWRRCRFLCSDCSEI